MIEITVYKKPNAKKTILEIFTIDKEDENFIKKNNIKISMENFLMGTMLYFDYGKIVDGDPDEYMCLCSTGENFNYTIKKSLIKIKNLMKL